MGKYPVIRQASESGVILRGRKCEFCEESLMIIFYRFSHSKSRLIIGCDGVKSGLVSLMHSTKTFTYKTKQ